MDRLACVDVPELPLQLLLRQQPAWREHPVAVVDEDKPLGLILYANRKARASGVLPGLRYGPALLMAPTLRAAPVADEAIQLARTEMLDRLYGFSPEIEPSQREPGVFWLDAGGLDRVFGDSGHWAGLVRNAFTELGFFAAVAVGFTRFGSFAAAKLLRGNRAVVFDTPEEEHALAMSVPLRLVGVSP